MDDSLKIGDTFFSSRLFVGTGKFGSLENMRRAIISSQTELVTAALKRVDLKNSKEDEFLESLQVPNVQLLPNTSGARNAKEAIFSAQLARDAFETNFIKLEIHPDPKYLMPDAVETLSATEELTKLGFVVMPYIHADPVLCKRLEDVGTACVMPLGSPIGSNKGLKTRDFLEIIISQSSVPVIVDAGIGVPSDACCALEVGADAVLVNTAIATSPNPSQTAIAFKEAVISGRRHFLAQGKKKTSFAAEGTSPLTFFS